MASPLKTKAQSVKAYLEEQGQKDTLRFITCGSVDDGKSTLIGRLLYDSKKLFDDQLSALKANGTSDHDVEIDFASLVDGLSAEQEQGITIDVAYRFFATEKRRFIVADTPGHEQYTRNMATGASTADAAIVLIDARKGVLTQTRRHSFILSLMGVRHVILAVNKMDLVDFDQSVFAEIEKNYTLFAEELGFSDVLCIPISALKGDNVFETGKKNMGWYQGLTIMQALESLQLASLDIDTDFRFPVQWVNRPNQDFRGFSGTVAAGAVSVGDEIMVLPSGKTSLIESILAPAGNTKKAHADEAVTISLKNEIDISRGDVLCHPGARPEMSDQFEVTIIWMDESPLIPERPFLIKTANKTIPSVVTRLKHKIDVNTMEELAASTLAMNEVGECNLSLDRSIAFDSFSKNKTMGSFVIIDRVSNKTVGAGVINFGLRRAQNIHWQSTDINKDIRARAKGQKPCVLWFTGLSGSGKSTIANLVEQKLHSSGCHTYLLDGDNIRHGLNRDLGFTEADRVENIRRISEVSRLMVDAGLIVLTAFISPFRAERQMARERMEKGEFLEIFVDTPLEECKRRDVKGLYKKAEAGEIKNFTGIDSPYEAPENPDVVIDTTKKSAAQAAEDIITTLKQQGFIAS